MVGGAAGFVFHISHQLVGKQGHYIVGAVGRQQDGNSQATQKNIPQFRGFDDVANNGRKFIVLVHQISPEEKRISPP